MTTVAIDTVDAVRDRIRDASSRGSTLRIAGRGTWLDAGRPVQAAETLSVRELAGITEYVPGDLTLTARAGTTLAEIRDATAEHNQWLALDPHGGDEGTIGATVATASYGPLVTFFGTPRDLTLGLEFVTGAGTVARGGGRVVKNVAGFDLTRLFVGSWGTLGVLTEVAVRLYARPEVDVSIAVQLGETDGDIVRVHQLLRRLPFKPFACEVVNARMARHALGAERVLALFRLGGNAEAVAAQRAALGELGDAREIESGVWKRVREAEPAGALVVRLSQLPSAVGATWAEARVIATACEGTLVHATPARGVVRCIIPPRASSVDWLRRAFEAPATTKRIAERLPDDLWPLVAPPAIADPISTRIKATFDPRDVLNPNILGAST